MIYLWPLFDALIAEKVLAAIDMALDADAAKTDTAAWKGCLLSSYARFVWHCSICNIINSIIEGNESLAPCKVIPSINLKR